MEESYWIVFEYTKHAGGYAGNRTRSMWPSKAEFDKDRHLFGPNKENKIIAEGITEDKSLELTSMTPPEARITASIHEIIESGGHPELARMELMNAHFAIAADAEELRRRGLK